MSNTQEDFHPFDMHEAGADPAGKNTNDPMPYCISSGGSPASSELATGVAQGPVDPLRLEFSSPGRQPWWARTASRIFPHLISQRRVSVPLTEDVLFIVFRQVVADEDPYNGDWTKPFTTQHSLSLVCRTWRLAAVHAPMLWRFIVIDSTKFRSAEDIQNYWTLVQQFLIRSRGRVHRLSLLNFPGPAPGCDAIWMIMISAILRTCERFYLQIAVPDDMSVPSYAAVSLYSMHVLLGDCESPHLSMATLTVGSFFEPPKIRYPLELPLFALSPKIEALAISGIDIRPSSYAVCSNCTLTSLEFCTGSYVNEIAPLIAGHHLTLQRLALCDILVDGVALPPDSLPSLTVLELAGRSSTVLEFLGATSLPKLTSIRIEFEEHWCSHEDLIVFVEHHPDIPVSELILCCRDGEFSAYVPVILALPQLRSLTIKGRIESTFFTVLSDHMWDMDNFAERLDYLHIVYAEPLDYIAVSFLAFLGIKCDERPNGALKLLALEPMDSSVRGMPLHYLDMHDACCMVEKCTIGSLPCARVLDDLSNWVQIRCIRVLLCMFFLVISSPFAYLFDLKLIALMHYLACGAVIVNDVILPCCVSRSTKPALEVREAAMELWDVAYESAYRLSFSHRFLDS